MKKRDGVVDEAAEARAEARDTKSRRENNGGTRRKARTALEKVAIPLEHGAAVEAINAELEKQDKGNLRIGEIVDGAIGPAGRADYGKQVIAGLAEDPDLMCSAEHLRRCWHYYRVMRDHGSALNGEFPELKYGHLYQISRVLQLEDEFSADKVRDTIRFVAKQAMDRGKGGKPTPIDALAKAVTTEIKSVRGCGLDGKADDRGSVGNAESQEDETRAAQDDYFALNDGIETVQIAAGKIAGSRRYERAAELQTNVARIAQAYLDILGHIVRHDPKSMIIPSARRCVRDLAALVGLTVVESGASEQSEVLP